MICEIINSGRCECIREPMGDTGLEGYNIRDIYTFEKCRTDDLKKYYRLYTNPESKYYETCGTTKFTEYFKVIKEKIC